MRNEQQGFSIIEGLMALALVGLLVVAGLYVFSRQNKNDIATDLQESSSAGKNTYRNDEIGLTFTYPPHWGEAVTKTGNDSDRSVPASGYTEFDITFPDVPLFILPIINNKNNYLVQRAGCFNSIGFLGYARSEAPDEFKSGDWEQSETSSGNSYTTYSKVLVGDDDTLVIESFEVSTVVSPQGYCNGLSIYGLREVSKNSKNLSEAQFIWSKTASTFGEDQPVLDLADLEDFKNNQSIYISEKDLSDLLETIRSIESY